jgi:protein arginine kinase activator
MSCSKNPASVKLTRLIKGNVEELWLCQDCASQQSPYHKKISSLSIETLLANILGQQKGEAAAKAAPAVDISCRTCGLPFDSYRSTLLLGCSDCYESFETYLQSDLRKFHGSTTHRGRTPEGEAETFESKRDPEDLRKRLQDAVESEDFELAARLRDEIRKAETRSSEAN